MESGACEDGDVPLHFPQRSSPRHRATPPLSINQHVTVQHPSCQHFIFCFADFFRQRGEQSGRGRREVRSPWQLSTSNPPPAEHPLSSPWQRRGPRFPGGRGECGRECETAMREGGRGQTSLVKTQKSNMAAIVGAS